MAFFRKWKTHYKHKKFTSDEAVDAEDWGLPRPARSGAAPNIEDMKLALECPDSEEADTPSTLAESYDVKYLGCTPIETKRSEKVISEAIKTVIANSKAGGRKSKSLKRVRLHVSPVGIEVRDEPANETLMKFSIYKISYCSVDAAHDHAFTFVGSETDPLSEQEKMSCHVFHCSKRKIAHEITLLVARCFENAYQQWRDTVVQQAKGQCMSPFGAAVDNDGADAKKILKEQNGCGPMQATAEVYQQQPAKVDDYNKGENLLIDLAASDSDVRKFLQNTWVSFEDEPHDGIHIVAC